MSVTSGTKTESGVGETIRVVIHALLIALVIRTFLFQPFNIPSGSMKATLLVGDPAERVELPGGTVAVVETETAQQLRNETDAEAVVLIVGAPPVQGKAEHLPDAE